MGRRLRHSLPLSEIGPGIGRAEALLAGFSNGVIARAVKAGAVREVTLRA